MNGMGLHNLFNLYNHLGDQVGQYGVSYRNMIMIRNVVPIFNKWHVNITHAALGYHRITDYKIM